MPILNDAIFEEIRQMVKEEVLKDSNQVKLEDAKIIAQALIPEIDRIVISKVNKLVRRLAMDVISWDLVKEKEEELLGPPPGYILVKEIEEELLGPPPGYIDEGNASRVEPIEKESLLTWDFQQKPFIEEKEQKDFQQVTRHEDKDQ